jgi:hypothetical protein
MRVFLAIVASTLASQTGFGCGYFTSVAKILYPLGKYADTTGK